MAVLNSVMRAFAVEALPTPADLLAQHPCSADMAQHIDHHRHQVRQILSGADDRLLVVIGPCSIHDPVAALDYAKRLARLATEYQESLQIVMRTYFEKPRTTVGWKGLVFDPHLDGSNDIGHGLHLARQLLLNINRLGLATRVLALSAYTDDAAIRGMVEAGAVGYLLKEEAPAAIVEAVRAAARGEGRWSAAVASKLARWAVRPAASEVGTDLSSRELEVVRWLAKGWDNQRIAQELHISEHTVRFHLRNIRDKIGVQTRTEAAVWAVRSGFGEG